MSILKVARDLYAAAPSHAPRDASPEPGTDCVCTAIATALAGPDARLNLPIKYMEDFDATLIRVVTAAGLDASMEGNALRRSVADWNAKHSTEDVLAVLDQAIEAT